jgi:hypothetical protein
VPACCLVPVKSSASCNLFYGFKMKKTIAFLLDYLYSSYIVKCSYGKDYLKIRLLGYDTTFTNFLEEPVASLFSKKLYVMFAV